MKHYSGKQQQPFEIRVIQGRTTSYGSIRIIAIVKLKMLLSRVVNVRFPLLWLFLAAAGNFYIIIFCQLSTWSSQHHGSLVLRGRSHTQHITAAVAVSVWIIKRLSSFHKSYRPDSTHCVSFKVVDKLCNVHKIVFGSIFWVPSASYLRWVCWWVTSALLLALKCFKNDTTYSQSSPRYQECENLENAFEKLLRNAIFYASA